MVALSRFAALFALLTFARTFRLLRSTPLGRKALLVSAKGVVDAASNAVAAAVAATRDADLSNLRLYLTYIIVMQNILRLYFGGFRRVDVAARVAADISALS